MSSSNEINLLIYKNKMVKLFLGCVADGSKRNHARDAQRVFPLHCQLVRFSEIHHALQNGFPHQPENLAVCARGKTRHVRDESGGRSGCCFVQPKGADKKQS